MEFSRELLVAVEQEGERFLEGVRSLRVAPQVSAEEVRQRIEGAFDFAAPLEIETVVDLVTDLLRECQVHVFHPRYFGLFNPSVTPASIVGDLLAAVWNPQLAAWSHSPAANEIERHLLAFLMRKIGWSGQQLFASFSSGGAEANFSAVVVALAEAIPEFRTAGTGSSRPRIYLSREAHHSFQKTAIMAGLGLQAVVEIPTTSRFRIDTAALREKIAEDRQQGFLPLMVVGTAGTTSGGVVDPLEELAAICRDEAIWFHADAAWGGSALLSPRLRGALSGIDAADSVTWDAHKWLSVPMGAGMFFCRHRAAVDHAFSMSTAYMPAAWSDAADPYATTAQWSRRAIGLKLFVSFARYGEDGYRAMIEQQAEMGELLRTRLPASGWRVVNETPLPLVCFVDAERPDDADRIRAVAAAVQNGGRAWISSTVLGGTVTALRACITSFATTASDLDVLLEELELARRSG
jgi:aromatic-L-amino-acid/L-tryptophan decarboxylase